MFNFKYKFISTIQKGSFGPVNLYKKRFGGKRVVVKKIMKCHFNPNEVVCLEKMRGVAGIQQLNEIYKGRKSVKLVLDYYPGSDLFDRVKYEKYIKGSDCVYKLILSIAERIRTCHEHGISHNDIKMENFVFDDDGRLVLIDFGMSCFFGDNERKCKLGTSYYAPPEFAEGKFYKTSDVYSLGAVYGVLLDFIGGWTSGYEFFKRMVAENHSKRPTIDEVIAYVKTRNKT